MGTPADHTSYKVGEVTLDGNGLSDGSSAATTDWGKLKPYAPGQTRVPASIEGAIAIQIPQEHRPPTTVPPGTALGACALAPAAVPRPLRCARCTATAAPPPTGGGRDREQHERQVAPRAWQTRVRKRVRVRARLEYFGE